jgi:hypothetical protein
LGSLESRFAEVVDTEETAFMMTCGDSLNRITGEGFATGRGAGLDGTDLVGEADESVSESD